MGYLWGTGRGAFGTRLARWIATGLVVTLMAAGPAFQMRAEARLRPLDQHAVVLNGNIVGSAFLIADGVAVTNRHVIGDLPPGATVTLLASGHGRARAEGRVIALSPRMDLALLEVPHGFLPQVAVEYAPEVAGLSVTAAGIDASAGSSGPRLEVEGVVLDPREDIPAFGPGLIALLPGARPGFSGGPLFDDRGRLVGMVTAIRPSPGGGTVASAGPTSGHAAPTVEAFALRAAELRAEVVRLLDEAGS